MARSLSSVMEEQSNTLALEDKFFWLSELRRDSSNVSKYVRDRRDITFNSTEYTSKPIAFEPPSADAGGTLQNFKIAIDNTDRVQTGYLEAGKYFDQEVIVKIVSGTSLNNDADSIVFRGLILDASGDEATVAFQCGTYDLRACMVPGENIYAKRCIFVFKGERCGYGGAEASCDHCIQTCNDTMSNKARFGGANNMSISRA